MTMNPFEQSTQQLLRFLTSHAEREVIDYIRQEIQHDAPDSIPTEEELFAFFQSPDEPTKLDAYQQMLATDKLLEYAEISLRTLCDLIRYADGFVAQIKDINAQRAQAGAAASSIIGDGDASHLELPDNGAHFALGAIIDGEREELPA